MFTNRGQPDFFPITDVDLQEHVRSAIFGAFDRCAVDLLDEVRVKFDEVLPVFFNLTDVGRRNG